MIAALFASDRGSLSAFPTLVQKQQEATSFILHFLLCISGGLRGRELGILNSLVISMFLQAWRIEEHMLLYAYIN